MFTKTDSKEAILASLDLFAGADRAAIATLASASDAITAAPGQVMIEQGVRHSNVYVVVGGTAAVQINDVPAAVIGAGEVFGELAFFSQGPATATVTAQSELSLLAVPFNRFDQVLEANPLLANSLLRNMAERLRAANLAWAH